MPIYQLTAAHFESRRELGEGFLSTHARTEAKY